MSSISYPNPNPNTIASQANHEKKAKTDALLPLSFSHTLSELTQSLGRKLVVSQSQVYSRADANIDRIIMKQERHECIVLLR